MTKASTVTTSDSYLFFTGHKTGDFGSPGLFVQKKQGAGFYYHFDEGQTERLRSAGGLATYRDTLLLVANEGFISMLDMTKFPPNALDFHDYTIEVTQDLTDYGNNSICAAMGSTTKAARSLSLISMDKETVTAKSILSAATDKLLSWGAATAATSMMAYLMILSSF